MEGTDADSFIILSTGTGGQIQTSAALNHEEKSSYSVTVRVRDGRGGTDAVNVTIRVTDVNGEVPDMPLAPTVTAVSSASLAVSWDAPENTGPPITDYDYRYRESSAGSWTEVTATRITGTMVTIEGLTASTYYDVEVRATNAEGTSVWSNPGIGATNAPGANNPPVFSEGASATRSVSATAPAGTSIGLPVAATDADSGDTLTYSLEGRDAASFDIRPNTGQLLTISGDTLTAAETYTVTVAADDGTDIARITVTITATAAPPNNPPVFTDGASATRSVSAGAQAGTSIGLPVAATDADQGDTLNYSLEGQDAASFNITPSTGQLVTISGVTLTAGEIYTVTVAASDTKTRAEITVTITITTALPNTPPTFSSTTATRSVDENTAARTDIGLPVSATDANAGDTLTYTLSGADAASFDIVSGTGQLRTNAALDYETKFRYSVTVTVSVGDLTDSISVTINVTDMHPSCASAIANGNTGLANDCEALLDSKATLEGTTGSLNWATFTPIAQWDGIYVNGSPKRVTAIVLRRWGLDGTIPAELARLPMLKELNLHSNRLTGTTPAELARLSRLEKLLLHNNRLTGTIPDLSRLRNLKMLWLSGKDMALTGGVPTWLNTMSGLEELTVWGNDLGGRIPYLAGMISLKRLDIRANGLTGSVPAWLGDMDSLGILYLASNDLSGEIPEELSRITRLVRLWLDRNDLTGSIPAELGNMTNLRTLNLRDNLLTGSIPPELGRLSNLVHLRLHNNLLTGSIPPELGRLSKVTQFYLSGHYMALTGSIPPELRDLHSVTHLSLWGNNLTGPIPPELGDLGDTLTHLRLGGNTGLTGCVPAALAGATAVSDLAGAGSNGLEICQ